MDFLSGIFEWFTGGEKKPPEILVLGAELHCMYGSKNTYLLVNEENIRYNGLPAACVLDRVELDNIWAFGECYQNGYCRDLMKLRERWENEEPQDTGLNGEEFITTESVLICERCGGTIQAVNSGQDHVGAEWINKELALMTRMKYMYSGLLEVMNDPNGSLYLTEGMYDTALKFLRDCWKNNGSNMDIISLFNQSSPEAIMMRNVMERLLPGFDMSGVDKFRDDLIMKGTEKGYDDVPGWNVDILNQEMFSLLEEECENTKRRMEEEPFYRLQEEHRSFMYTLSDASTILSFYVVANKGLGSNKDVGEKEVQKTQDKQKVQQKNEGKGEEQNTHNNNNYEGRSNLEDDLFRNVYFKKNDIRMVDQVAREVGIDRYKFREYIHEMKDEHLMRPKDNFTRDQLINMANDLKND